MSRIASLTRVATIGAIVVAMAGSALAADAVAVVINKSLGETNVSRLDVVAIFTGSAPYWGDKSEITVILPPSADLLANLVFYKFLGTSSSRLRMKWTSALAQGQARRPPIQPKDAADALGRLSKLPGGIAVLSLADVQKYPNASGLFTILSVDGHKPGEAGYPLNR